MLTPHTITILLDKKTIAFENSLGTDFQVAIGEISNYLKRATPD